MKVDQLINNCFCIGISFEVIKNHDPELTDIFELTEIWTRWVCYLLVFFHRISHRVWTTSNLKLSRFPAVLLPSSASLTHFSLIICTHSKNLFNKLVHLCFSVFQSGVADTQICSLYWYFSSYTSRRFDLHGLNSLLSGEAFIVSLTVFVPLDSSFIISAFKIDGWKVNNNGKLRRNTTHC